MLGMEEFHLYTFLRIPVGSTSASHDFIGIEKMIFRTSSCVNNLNSDIGNNTVYEYYMNILEGLRLKSYVMTEM